MRTGIGRFLVVLLLFLAPFTALPLSASAGSSGGVEASSAGIGFTPSEPVMGGSVTISISLFNSNPTTANNVEYSFYKDSVTQENILKYDVVNIPGNAYTPVSAVWNGLQEGPQQVWFEVTFSGDTPVRFFKDFNVSGLANLEVISIELSPASGLRIGDNGTISSTVKNTGTVEAQESILQVGIYGQPDSVIDVSTPTLAAGESAMINASLLFAESGNWTVTSTPDAYDNVTEVAEGYGEKLLEVEVLPYPDYRFSGPLSITSPAENLDGPWTVSGTVIRSYGIGNETVNIGFSVESGNQVSPVISPISVAISGEGESIQPFSAELDAELQGLAVGEYALTAHIDPYGWLTQSDISNDNITGQLNIRPIPNVQVDPASPNSMIVNAGDKVNWYVLLTNTGDISVSGRLNYSWEGQSNLMSGIINIEAFSSQAWEIELSTGQGSHSATFSAHWEPLSTSFDSNEADSYTTVSITVTDSLALTFLASTGALTLDSAVGAPTDAPLKIGTTYAYTVTISSSGEGSENLSCAGNGEQLSLTMVNFSVGDNTKISCIFTVEEATPYGINILAVGGTAQTHSRLWEVSSNDASIEDEAESFGGLVLIFGFAAALFIGILVAAFLLTREREEEVERDIFDYCPACDGEIDGDEKNCPHCSFNLAKARRRFHDCKTCNENIPSIISHCPFCGAEQDVSSHYEKRQRREIKALPEEEEEDEEEDEDEIVTGTADFDSAIQEFGYEAGQLESDWDEKFASAEAEMEELEARLGAQDFDESDDDVAEPLLTKTSESFSGEGLDSILEGRKDLVAVEETGDDLEDLSASDAEIREKLFAITGEEGVLPGDEVVIGMGLSDRGLAGNEIPEDAMDFSFEDDELTPISVKQKRSAVRRRSSISEMGECGACGAEIAMDAEECGACGARYSEDSNE